MVHRPADSRLLTNLLSQEKDYTKHLNHVLDSSNASLASFSAYAAASPPPTSTVIMNVVGSLAAADEALRRYRRGVEEWREMMKQLKEAEDEVGNIMRDREILVNRLIKASKSERKNTSTGNFRDSLLLGHKSVPSSSSSLSLSVGNQESPSPSPSRPLSASFSSSSKLAAAQSELQACENHLAAKERELAIKRCLTVRDGLGTRIRALIECGWVWGEVGKQALQALEELKVESMEQNSLRPLLVPEPHITSLTEEQGHDFLHAEPESTRHSSDHSSISPSQSASQRGEELPPPAISFGSLMGQLDDSSKKDNADVNRHDSLQVQSHAANRPSSGFSMATTGSSIYYSPATPATYKLETMTYAPAVALHVPAKEKEREREILDVLPPPGSELFKEMRIPAPHAMNDEDAYRMPTARLTSLEPVAGPSRHEQQHVRTASSSALSTPQNTSSLLKATISQQQQVSVTAPRRVLERRITEEDIQKMSVDKDDSSSLEEVVDESKLLKEGKLEMVENPKFMTGERKRELEREKMRREEAERKRLGEGKEREKGTEGEKEKKLFTFFHSPSHPRNVAEGKEQGSAHVRFTEQQPDYQAGGPSSPSKRFLGSLKDFFVGTKHPSPAPSPTPRGHSRSLSLPRNVPSDLIPSDDDVEDDSDSDTPGRSSRGGLQSIFRGKKSKAKKDKAKEKEFPAPRWYTRTDKNIREIVERRASYDGVVGISSGAGDVGVGRTNFGRAIATDAVANAGKLPVRNRTVSDVGLGPASAPATGAGGGSGRRLKKTRAGGGGPAISPSAGAALSAATRGSGEDSGSLRSTASLTIEPSTGARVKTAGARAPTPAFSGGVAAKVGPSSSILKVPPLPATRRSASVDNNSMQRRSWEEEVDEEEGEEEGMIVDLGRRRRTASEIGKGSPTATTTKMAAGAKVKGAPAKSTLSKVKGTAATPGYSSDTAAMAPASTYGVPRKKSLTKKRSQPPSNSVLTTLTIPPLPTTMPPVPTARLPTSSTTFTPAKPGLLKPPSSVSPHPSHRATQSSTTLATVLPANNNRPSGTLASSAGPPQQSLGWNATGGLSRNSSITSAASAPPGGKGGRKQSTLGQGITSGVSSGGGPGMVRRSSLGGGSPAPAVTPSKSASPTAPTNKVTSVVQPSQATSTLMSIVEGVSRANKEGWGQEKNRKSVGGTQKPAELVELGSVKAPSPLKREALAEIGEAQIKALASGAGGQGMTSTSSLSTVTPASAAAAASRTKAGPALFEIRAPGSVFDARNVPSYSAESASALSVAQPQPRRARQQHEQVQVWATGTVPNGGTSKSGSPGPSAVVVPKAPSPLRSVLKYSSSRSPSPAAVRPNGAQQAQAQTQTPPQLRVATAERTREEEDAPPSPENGTLPWGRDGALKQSALGNGVDKRKGKQKEAVPPVEETSDTESFETGHETLSDHEQDVERKEDAIAPAVIVSQAESLSAGKVVNGDANGHAVEHDQDRGHSGSSKNGLVLSQSDASTLTGAQSQSLQPQSGAGNANAPAQLTTPTPRRRKSVRVSLQPTYSPSPPAIEYTPEEEQKEYAPWASDEARRERERRSSVGGHHLHHPSPKSTTIATQLLPRPAQILPPHPPSAPAASGEEEKIRDMWADSDESEDEDYARAKRMLTRAAKKEKDVQRLVTNQRR